MRLTTDNPKNNMESARNLFYIKDGETWVLGGGPEPDYKDVSLYDFVRRITELHGLDIITTDNESMGEHLCDLLMENVDTIEGVVALLYTAAWAFSELRERLKAYEDKIPFDRLDETAALVKARDEGRLHIYEKSYKCPQCGAYRLTPRVDKLFYFCFCCRSQFTRAEAEAALGGGGDD